MQVVLPKLQFRRAEAGGLALRPPTLDGKRIGFIDGWGNKEADGKTTMYPLMVAYRERLEKKYDIPAFKWLLKPSVSKPLDDAVLDEFLADVDVVINGEAICGSCTYSAVFDGVEIEKRGKPSVTIAHDGFRAVAGMHAKMMGMPSLSIIIEPQPDSNIIGGNISAVADATFENLVRALTSSGAQEGVE
jgi:hypothetical protein